MSKLIVGSLVCVVALGMVVGWVLLTRPPHEAPKLVSTVNAESPKETWRDRVLTPKDGKSPAEVADIEFNNLHEATDRLALLAWAVNQGWATSKSPVLRKALIADPSEAVQISALERSIQLATAEDPTAVNDVIRAGLSAANPRIVQQSLREARKHPSADLVPDLLEIADSSASHRFLAIDALAFTDDPRARSKVVEVASREDGEKTERVRAVALLSKVNDERSLAALGQLTGHADPDVRAVALEALAARQTK